MHTCMHVVPCIGGFFFIGDIMEQMLHVMDVWMYGYMYVWMDEETVKEGGRLFPFRPFFFFSGFRLGSCEFGNAC
jgi:hypothetical protein